jgi:hypothetical protein
MNMKPRIAVDPDVLATARDFGIDPALLQAVVDAEGDIVRAVHCSIPTVTTREQALRAAARSAVHAMNDWIKFGGSDRRDAFIGYWGGRWTPLNPKNDSDGLYVDWSDNVEREWVPSEIES